MQVLLIGGTGLISTGITRQLVDEGYDVACFTRGETDAQVPDAVEFVHGDRENPGDLAAARDAVEPDAVIDMFLFHPDRAREAVEVFGGEIEQYVFCSTVDVYHRPLATNPVQEDAPREPAVSEYGANKAAAEDVFMEAHDDGEFATTVIRPWSTYGESGPVLHSLGMGTYYVDRIRKGKPILVHGSGQSLWGPCHRDDVANAFVNAVGNDAAYGEAYHVTSEEVITWDQYHETVAAALDAPEPELVHVPTDQLRAVAPDRTDMLMDHFQFSTVFDNSKARRDLDFEYTVSFEEGVRRTVSWLDEHDEVDAWDSQNDDAIIDAWRDATEEFQAQIDGSDR
ncbi:NAD-dependent epimerase/dehydratase [Salinarchaeum sp. Harcht-Bsk1]|uniref:NAD-dependent epimerase/dehydratase family protein n=1 Tax=Salinarchaeum sp. Harcht-Bsk1 TaxID=1333523 RepID=UPI000342402D|nr:NAD-dependent epimerase/dehydratase family protein [Salinarchaeum sp. Harcht-Bsk1]AGN00829.1 NAD-dependent epimerase/dehydratase [Salinarchaeum sp. Harcht-Bsk1]